MNLPARPSLSREERLNWLRLIRSENVGPVTFRQLMNRYGGAAAALDALPELAARGGRKRPIKICPKAAAERELAALERAGVTILALGTEEYPPLLAAIDDAPPLLFVRGHPDLLLRPTVSIVGARNASANGRKMARDIARELGAEGFAVVSGLARGIDAAAHTGSLELGTVAVMAGGVDVIYPPQHEDMYAEIVARGVAIAENPLGTEPQQRHFPRRNRLISGMSMGVLVVEAAVKSGSLITARMALEQNREVFAIPGSPLDPRSKGCNHLIKQGANVVENGEDIVTVLAGQLRSTVAESPGSAYEMGGLDLAAPDENVLAEARAEVLELLSFTPVAVDEVIRECQFSPSVVTMALLELELAGRCERRSGNFVALLQEDAETLF